MNRFFLIASFLLCYSAILTAQTIKKTDAVRTDHAPKVDGILDDEAWKSAPVAGGFVEGDGGVGVNNYYGGIVAHLL